jgi:hypothetical protein
MNILFLLILLFALYVYFTPQVNNMLSELTGGAYTDQLGGAYLKFFNPNSVYRTSYDKHHDDNYYGMRRDYLYELNKYKNRKQDEFLSFYNRWGF